MRILILLFFVSTALHAQQAFEQQQVELDRLKVEFSNSYYQQKSRAEEYARKNNVPLIQSFLDGTVIQLVDVDAFGKPVYISTLNSGLAASTNVVKLREGGGLGLNLRGSGMEVGVWDSGPVFEHNEFSSRILSREGGTASDHGTHVTGTILATGLNSNAMGMAPEAKLHSYDWTNDRAEMIAMARPDQTGLLFSNHSYGLVQGWNCSNGSCTWFGTASISDKEDWRFGFYTTLSRDLDQIAFSAPYYSIFWAAGNDRDDYATNGPALYPQDGNQGSGYDCIGQEGTAKNIFTIGASRKVTDYTGPSSIEMSSFSGWGPTDDGRIKPDLVAPGVGILSTVTDNSYSIFQGTSMATPGAMGSLVLLQELHRDLNGGNFMRSATLKALAIHSAKEAGLNPGPDYSYGWGLIDVEAAAKVLLTKDNQNVYVEELTLTSGQTYELMLTPQANKKITATIAWTDPAGTPVGSSLDPTNLMLVNDLDMRLVDDANNQQFPWALNPDLATLAEAAFKADNFRDNVEKIEFENPEPRSYKLRINHKGTLAGGAQNFSLIITYTSINEPQTAYYWVGGSGEWSDPAHWSLTSGGVSAGVVPNQDNRIVVDENSFSLDNELISLTEDAAIGSMTWLSKSQTGLNLNGHTLTIRGNLTLASDKAYVSSVGKIVLEGTLYSENKVLSSNNDFSKVDLEVNASSIIDFVGSLSTHSLNLISGTLNLTGSTLAVQSLIVSGSSPKSLNLTNTVLTEILDLELESNSLDLISVGTLITPMANSTINLGNNRFEGKLHVANQDISLLGNNSIKEVLIEGKLLVKGNNSIDLLTLQGGSGMIIDAGMVQTLTETTVITSSESSRVSIEGAGGNAAMNFDGRFKLCFDYLDLKNVDATGDGVINAGLASTMINSSNWAQDECEDILFPDFETKSNCANGIINLIDKSGGAIETWTWSTNDAIATLVHENEKNGEVIFPQAGEYEITLRITNSNDSRSYKKSLMVVENDLLPNQIILNGLNLFSTQPGDSYEWYRDYEVIPGAKGRSYPFNGEPGSYFVLTKSSACNRISNTVLITGFSESLDPATASLNVFPNPAEDQVSVRGLSNPSTIKVINAFGQQVYENTTSSDVNIQVSQWSRGIYFVIIVSNQSVHTQKIILR